jgi:hypothetical protein
MSRFAGAWPGQPRAGGGRAGLEAMGAFELCAAGVRPSPGRSHNRSRSLRGLATKAHARAVAGVRVEAPHAPWAPGGDVTRDDSPEDMRGPRGAGARRATAPHLVSPAEQTTLEPVT